MAIRVVLVLLLLLGMALVWWAQIGESTLLMTSSYLAQALQERGQGAENEALLSGLWSHMQCWKLVFYLGLAVFVLSFVGLCVLGKPRHGS